LKENIKKYANKNLVKLKIKLKEIQNQSTHIRAEVEMW
jgi:hypothetical protein